MLARTVAFILLLEIASGATAQDKPSLRSPVVEADGRVTFNLKAAKAERVVVVGPDLQRAFGADALKMTKNDDGVWSVTIGPVAPGIYDYSFDVDGLKITDPLSTHVFGNRTGSRGYLEVPGPKGSPRVDEWRDVPHGAVVAHWYPSKATGTRRRVQVYVPPSYDADKQEKFPVVYLLHGSGDDDRHWTLLGQANVIADNLIADGKMKPALIVMPEGHPAGAIGAADKTTYYTENRRLFADDLLNDVVPLVESKFRARTDPRSRAIVGLSMGGQQALDVGLNNLDKFVWVGSFSGAASRLDAATEKLAADPSAANERLTLLWIAIGKDDFLLDSNREFVAKLKELGIRHEYLETDGAHTWMVWRRYLADFLPRLFH